VFSLPMNSSAPALAKDATVQAILFWEGSFLRFNVFVSVVSAGIIALCNTATRMLLEPERKYKPKTPAIFLSLHSDNQDHSRDFP